MFRKLFFASALLSSVIFQSCKPNEDPPAPAPVTAPELTLPFTISNVDGILATTRVDTKNAGKELIAGTAHAMFFKSKNPTVKYEAGSVKINSKDAIKSDDNTYFYAPTIAEPAGLVFQNQVYWKATGNTANDIPVIDINDGGGFPFIPSVGEFISMNTYQDKIITWANSSGADSVILTLKGPSGVFRKVFKNSVSSYSLPKEEIAKVGTTTSGILSVNNYSLQYKTVGTKNYAFIKQSIGLCTKVTITN